MKRAALFAGLFLILIAVIVTADYYTLRPGDTINISVLGHAEFSTEALVAPDGTISVPPIGIVEVVGVTLSTLETMLSDAFVERDFLRTKPQITVSVTKFSEFNYNVLGEVGNPGTLFLKETSVKIPRILGLAGGFKETADPSSAFIIRSDGTREIVDLSRLIADGTGAEILMRPDDTLFVPSGVDGWISVIGEVRNPGVVPFREGLTLIQIIAASGGTTASADVEDVMLLTIDGSERVHTSVNLTDVIAGRIDDPVLSKGTAVVIDDLTLKSIRVIGEVRNPANVKYVKGISLLQVLGQTGGISSLAGRSILVLRTKNLEQEYYDLDELMKGAISDPLLEPGDTVVVPRETERFVYVTSPQGGGRVDFSSDETMTLRNALTKLNLFDPRSYSEITVLDPTADPVTLSMAKLADQDMPVSPGTAIIAEDTSIRLHILGAVRSPGTYFFTPAESPDLLKLISRAGGMSVSAMRDSIQINPHDDYPVSIDFDSLLEEDGKFTSLQDGTIVYVPEIPERFVYVISQRQGGRIDFSRDEKLSMRVLLAKLSVPHEGARDEVVVFDRLGKRTTYDLSAFDEADLVLDIGSIVMFPDLEKEVHVFGAVRQPGLVLFSLDKLPDLLSALSRSGGLLDEADAGNIRIIDVKDPSGRTVDLETLITENRTIPLSGGELIYVPERATTFVYILGEVTNPGMKIFEPYEDLSLQRLISKAGGLTENAGVITIRLEDTVKRVESALISESDQPLLPGSVVNVVSAPERYVYVVSQDAGGRVEFTRDENITLRNTLSKLNLLDILSPEKIQLIKPDGTREEFILDRLRYSDRALEAGTVILYPEIRRRIHVLGAVQSPGTVYLDLSEQMTLSAAVSKSGGALKTAETNRLQITESLGRTTTVNLDRILVGLDDDPVIEHDSIVYVPEYKPIIVSVLGEVSSPGTVRFEMHESPDLLTAIAKAGGLKDTASPEVRITTTSRTYSWVSLLAGTPVRLETGSTVFVPRSDSYVYVVGVSEATGRVGFSSDEEMSLLTLLGKLGGDPGSHSQEIRVIEPDGTIKTYLINEVLRSAELPVLKPRSTVIFADGTKRITVLGHVRNPGVYDFSPREKSSLSDVIAKAGGIADIEKAHSLLVQSGRTLKEHGIDALRSRTEELPDLSFVFVVPYPVSEVSVLGDVRNPGLIRLDTKHIPSLTEVIAAAGGVNPTAGAITVLRAGQVIASLSVEDIKDSSQVMAKDGDVVIVERDDRRFVTVLGDVKNPGVFDISQHDKLTVGLALSLAGGLVNPSSTGRAHSLHAGQELVFDLSPETFSAVAQETLYRGSLLFVPPQAPQSVFVFGEVRNPGVFPYLQGMDALEAVLNAGGPTQYGVMKNVVVFFGGIESDPVIVDLDRTRRTGEEELDVLPAGSVVYVPKSSIVNIKEIMGIVANSLSIVKSALDIVGHSVFRAP